MPYRRKLSPYERLWLAAQTSCGFVMVEGRGEISANKLRAAVDIATAANPGSRIALKGVGPWCTWEENDIPPAIEEADGSQWDGSGKTGMPFSDQAHMDPKGAPSTSYVILRGPVTRLIQRTHHATMDGLGAMHFLQDVFRALRGEPVVGATGSESDLDLAERLGGHKQTLDFNCLKPFASPSTKVSGSDWARVRTQGKLRPQALARLIHTIAGIARESGDGQVLIDVPVNLRPKFPEIRNTGNLAGSLRLNIASEADIDSIAALIQSQLASHREVDALITAKPFLYMPLWLIRALARRNARQAVQEDRFAPTAAVSNLGRIDPATYSSPDFSAESMNIVPPGYDGLPLFIALSGHAQGFDLCARAPVALASDGRLQALLQRISAAIAA